MASECKYPFHEALAKLEAYCAYQERCSQEIQKKLDSWGLSFEDCTKIIRVLKENRFFDDERFCESFVSGKVRIKRWGRIKIRYELKLKGIKEEVIRKALSEIDPIIYEENLKELTQRKWAETKGDEWTRKAKLHRFLLSKGYENDLISDALKSVITT
jgi:regulatory protein